ncbi:MAG: bifunctional chorismate mutase/prephenate dehydratase [Acidobacteriota bacterium]
MAAPRDLQDLRETIEAIDRDLLTLLRRRMDQVDAIADAKIQAASPFRDREREDRVFQRVRQIARSLDLDSHRVEQLYRQIMEMSIARQQEHLRSKAEAPLRVAYQGVEGSYSHLAAQGRYGGRPGGALLTGFESFHQAAEAVRRGEADFALLPVENSTAGSILQTYDELASGDLVITGEVIRAIEHCLLALPGARFDDLRRVLSHPQGLLQCEEFLRRHPQLEPRAEFDTAGAARKVRQGGDPTVAAIASESAAKVYGLEIMERGIQTAAGNATRFFEVGIEAALCPPDVDCKTSLQLVLSHTPGALGKVLTTLAEHNVNVCKLESRPRAGTPWEYRFYLDLEGHGDHERVAAAIAAVRPLTVEMARLGTYPKG